MHIHKMASTYHKIGQRSECRQVTEFRGYLEAIRGTQRQLEAINLNYPQSGTIIYYKHKNKTRHFQALAGTFSFTLEQAIILADKIIGKVCTRRRPRVE